MIEPFILIPISLYLLFSGLFLQQGLTNIILSRTGLTHRRSYLLYFVLSSLVFCLSLLLVLLSPSLGFSPSAIRWAFFACWLVAPIVGYLYVLALAQHLEISFERIRWFTVLYALDFCFTCMCGIYTALTGKGVLFAHERGAYQSLIDIHLGGAFSPNAVTLAKVVLISALVIVSTTFFLKAIFKKAKPDLSLVAGIILTATALVLELVGYVFQWSMIFSLLPLANAVEVVRLTYLETLRAGRSMELERQAVRRERMQMQSYLTALSHDVRTPLTSLKIGLSRDVKVGGFESLRRELALEVEYMHVVFSNIVTFFELELSGQTSAQRLTDIRTVLSGILHRFGGLATERSIDVNMADEDGPLEVHCNPATIEQALSNLVYNALVHAEKQVAISVFMRGDMAIIRILDDGPGFELDEPAHKNQAGYRELLAANTQNPGWGLGLAISQALASISGGKLAVGFGEGETMSVEFSVPAYGDRAWSENEALAPR